MLDRRSLSASTKFTKYKGVPVKVTQQENVVIPNKHNQKEKLR